MHSTRKITVPAFPLILKITIIPSMQLSRIRERPGVSIFQLRMDNRAGGVWTLWWHHPTLIMARTRAPRAGEWPSSFVPYPDCIMSVSDKHRDGPQSGANTGRILYFTLSTVIINLCVLDSGKVTYECEWDVWRGARSRLSEKNRKNRVRWH